MDSLALLKAGFQSIQWTAAHKWKATTALTVAVALLALAALTVLPQPERNPYGMHEVVAVEEEDAEDERETEGASGPTSPTQRSSAPTSGKNCPSEVVLIEPTDVEQD
mgnify:CR=1 FL=1